MTTPAIAEILSAKQFEEQVFIAVYVEASKNIWMTEQAALDFAAKRAKAARDYRYPNCVEL